MWHLQFNGSGQSDESRGEKVGPKLTTSSFHSNNNEQSVATSRWAGHFNFNISVLLIKLDQLVWPWAGQGGMDRSDVVSWIMICLVSHLIHMRACLDSSRACRMGNIRVQFGDTYTHTRFHDEVWQFWLTNLFISCTRCISHQMS